MERWSRSDVDDRRSITGKITGDDGLGGISSVRVELRDPSSRETRAKLIGFTKISDVTSFPIPYEVNFNASDIIRDHTLVLTASIRGPDGILRFVNQRRLRPDLNGPGPFAVDIHVKLSKTTQELPSVCQPVDCRHEENLCPYGYLDKDGCQTCECNDPCYPSNKVMPCEFNRSCYVIQDSNGAYRARCVPSRATNNHKNDKPSKGKHPSVYSDQDEASLAV